MLSPHTYRAIQARLPPYEGGRATVFEDAVPLPVQSWTVCMEYKPVCMSELVGVESGLRTIHRHSRFHFKQTPRTETLDDLAHPHLLMPHPPITRPHGN